MDGWRIGAFASRCEAEARLACAAAARPGCSLAPVTARDVFGGSVAHDSLRILDVEAATFGIHPWGSIEEVLLDDDNGLVVRDLPTSQCRSINQKVNIHSYRHIDLKISL